MYLPGGSGKRVSSCMLLIVLWSLAFPGIWNTTNTIKAHPGSYRPTLKLVWKVLGSMVIFTGTKQYFRGENVHQFAAYVT